MAWTPTHKVLTARAIPETLLAFFEANQEDAFAWAGRPELKKFKSFANSVVEARRAQKPIYPAIAFRDDNDAQSLDGDIIGGGYQFTFEIYIVGRNPDQVVEDARVYAQAVASMVANANLTTGTGATKAVIDRIEIAFDEIADNPKGNEFLQMFEIKTTVQLFAGAYE